MDESLTLQRQTEEKYQLQEDKKQLMPQENYILPNEQIEMNKETDAVRQSQKEKQSSAFLLTHFKTMKPTDTAAATQEQRSTLDKKNGGKESYKKQNKIAQTDESGVLSEEDVANIEVLRQSSWGGKTWMKEIKKGSKFTQNELYQQTLNGDFKDFEHLDEPLRNALASRWMRERFVKPLPNQTPEEYVRKLAEVSGTEGLMHPLFRLGISLAMRSGFGGMDKEFFKELDIKCCSEIMVMTLSKQISKEEKKVMIGDRPETDKNKAGEAVEKDIMRNQGFQIFMAKNLLLMHMSKFSLKKEGEKDREWPYDVSAAYGHCSRVSFILPPLREIEHEKERHGTMWSTLREVGKSALDRLEGNACGIFRRGASTHDFSRRKVVRKNSGGEFEEKKRHWYNPNFVGQEGMNVAIGGLHNAGVGMRRIENDGSCGHVYFMKREATKDEYGGYIIGVESDSYKKTNQLGHTHGFGNGEHASSFGGQRDDEIGEKYGGRVCDLGEISPDEITARMLQLENYMRLAMSEGVDMTSIMRLLSGTKMDAGPLSKFFTLLDTKTAQIESLNPGKHAGIDGKFD